MESRNPGLPQPVVPYKRQHGHMLQRQPDRSELKERRQPRAVVNHASRNVDVSYRVAIEQQLVVRVVPEESSNRQNGEKNSDQEVGTPFGCFGRHRGGACQSGTLFVVVTLSAANDLLYTGSPSLSAEGNRNQQAVTVDAMRALPTESRYFASLRMTHDAGC